MTCSKSMFFSIVFDNTKKNVQKASFFPLFLTTQIFMVSKKSTFFELCHSIKAKQTPPPELCGAFRGDPELNVGALTKPIYTRARINDWR